MLAIEKSSKLGLFSNLKKCRFYEDKIRFLGFVVLAKIIIIKEKKLR